MMTGPETGLIGWQGMGHMGMNKSCTDQFGILPFLRVSEATKIKQQSSSIFTISNIQTTPFPFPRSS